MVEKLADYELKNLRRNYDDWKKETDSDDRSASAEQLLKELFSHPEWAKKIAPDEYKDFDSLKAALQQSVLKHARRYYALAIREKDDAPHFHVPGTIRDVEDYLGYNYGLLAAVGETGEDVQRKIYDRYYALRLNESLSKLEQLHHTLKLNPNGTPGGAIFDDEDIRKARRQNEFSAEPYLLQGFKEGDDIVAFLEKARSGGFGFGQEIFASPPPRDIAEDVLTTAENGIRSGGDPLRINYEHVLRCKQVEAFLKRAREEGIDLSPDLSPRKGIETPEKLEAFFAKASGMERVHGYRSKLEAYLKGTHEPYSALQGEHWEREPEDLDHIIKFGKEQSGNFQKLAPGLPFSDEEMLDVLKLIRADVLKDHGAWKNGSRQIHSLWEECQVDVKIRAGAKTAADITAITFTPKPQNGQEAETTYNLMNRLKKDFSKRGPNEEKAEPDCMPIGQGVIYRNPPLWLKFVMGYEQAKAEAKGRGR